MIPELGHFALIIALCMAVLQSVVPLAGAQRGLPSWIALAPRAARAQFGCVLIAFMCLTWSFIAKDFSVAYVVQNSNAALPTAYRIAAVWGAHEGSLLLWTLILAGWTLAVTAYSRSLPATFSARVIAVMGIISIGFILLMLMTSNPFERLLPAAQGGRDLNPLLQDPGLIIHPPMLYMGYVGMAVPFSFAIAALLDGRLDLAWSRWTRPWTLVAWVCLTIGITLGSWWAYYELGWGGWWFWDPVENASFMPWLVATALLHTLAVTEKRGAFKAWTVILAIFGFSLSLLGTFLVRSGVLVSVHAFASDPERGLFILIFLTLVVGSALVLYAWRAASVSSGGTFALVSRESMLLVNNVLLTVAAATVLLGTLYPLIMDSLNLGKVSVGPPYFNGVFVPLMLPLVFLIGIGPAARWKRANIAELAIQLRLAFFLSVGFAIICWMLIAQVRSLMVVLGIGLAAWVITTTLQAVVLRLRQEGDPIRALRTTPRSFFGMALAHTGVAIFVAGVTIVSTCSVEKDVRMVPGATQRLAGYDFRFDGVRATTGPNYRAQEGAIRVSRDDREVAVLHPQKRHYLVQSQPMTEAAIDAALLRDIYVALGEPLGEGAWSVRIYYKPLVRWIWLGPLIMALGGLLSASDRRYRVARQAAGESNPPRALADTAGAATEPA